LIHDYLGVDIDAVWETIKKDIPALKNKIKKSFKNIELIFALLVKLLLINSQRFLQFYSDVLHYDRNRK